jgi:hypothetical protein
VYTAAQVRAALGLTEPPRDLRVTARNASSRVASLEATGATTGASFTGTASRTKLKLRSTWFFVGVLSLTPSASTVTYGKQVKLAGLARRGGTSGWGTARLERKRHGESWTPIGAALPDGAWSRTVTPRIGTDYRVVSGNATGTTHRVSVRTRVTIAKPRAPFRRLTGLVQPARAGIAVTLERKRADGTWTLAAKTRTGAAGRFAFAVARPGTYRARADAGAGYLAGCATVKLPLV